MTRPPARLLARLALAASLPFLLAPASARAGSFDVAGEGGWMNLNNAKESAQAIFDGGSGGFVFGGGVRYALGEHFFIGGTVRFFQKTGERVFVADAASPVYPLGHPLKIRIIPAYASFGYRFLGSESSFVPYVGAGVGATSLREESSVGGVSDTESQTKASFHVFGGAELGRGSVRFGGEIGWTTVPSSLGLGGVSAIYDESDIGGFSAVARLIFRP